MKRDTILIYYSSNDISFFSKIVLELEKKLQEKDLFTIKIDLAADNWQSLIQEAIKHKIYFTIGFNHAGLGLAANGKYICEMFNYPHISIMTEVAYNRLSEYLSDIAISSSNNIILYLDKNDIGYINKVRKQSFGNFHSVFSLFAGMKAKAHIAKKDIEVLYSGNYIGEAVRGWNNKKYSVQIKRILNMVADYLEKHSVSVPIAFKIIEKRHGIDNDMIKQLYNCYEEIFQYIKMYRREKIVTHLVNLNINFHICGNWSHLSNENISVHRIMNYQDLLLLYKRSKIVIQDNAGINGGIHERVFSAMLNGAVVVSEYNKYISHEFVDKKEIMFFDLQKLSVIDGYIDKLLNDDKERKKIAFNAYKKVSRSHTWENRIEKILKEVERWYSVIN